MRLWIGRNLLCVLLLIQCFQLILQLSDLLLQAACLSLRQRSQMLLRLSLLLSGFAQSLNTSCEQSRSSITHLALVQNQKIQEESTSTTAIIS